MDLERRIAFEISVAVFGKIQPDCEELLTEERFDWWIDEAESGGRIGESGAGSGFFDDGLVPMLAAPLILKLVVYSMKQLRKRKDDDAIRPENIRPSVENVVEEGVNQVVQPKRVLFKVADKAFDEFIKAICREAIEIIVRILSGDN